MEARLYKANAAVEALDKDENNAATENPEGQTKVHEDVEYIKGHPVIRTGADASWFIASDRDDGDPALTFRSTSVLRFMNFGQHFGIKEHVVAALIASSGNNGLAGDQVHAVSRPFYDFYISASTAVLSIFSIALCGFVLAGVLRPFIVYPAEMAYWSTLPQVVLYRNLHFNPRDNKRRLIMFGWALGIAAVWELFPTYMMTRLGGLSVFCLASLRAPTHTRKTLTTIFGGASSNEGMGLFNFSPDWQYIQSTYLSVPFKQQINTWIGYAIFYVVMAGVYYGNAWDAKSFPFMSTSLFHSNGPHSRQTPLPTPRERSTTRSLSRSASRTSSTVPGYLTQNLAIGALISHVLVFYWKDMATAWKQARSRTQPGPHYQGMLEYKDVPMWCYYTSFVLVFFAGLIVTIKGQTTLPAWGYIVSLFLGAFIAPFSCVLYGLYGTGVILLSVHLANWLKFMFATQIYGTLLGAALNYVVMIAVVMIAVVTNQREILIEPIGNNVWSGSIIQRLNSQAITWSLAEVYGTHGRYLIIPLGLIIGLIFSVIHLALIRVFPRIRNWPLTTTIILSYAGQTYYGSTSWVWSSIAVGVFNQFWLRKRLSRIYSEYNYLIGVALDGGSQLIIFILSFAVLGG
ncbi:OPT oligopeptide transporter protein-domain-containing protein [Aspergillus fruticulosus]